MLDKEVHDWDIIMQVLLYKNGSVDAIDISIHYTPALIGVLFFRNTLQTEECRGKVQVAQSTK